MAEPRLQGQQISIRIIEDGSVVNEIDSIGTFDDGVKLALKEDGFLGEPVNRFDEVLEGYTFSFEYQPTKADHMRLVLSIEERARREVPNRVFNIVRTDFFSNGSTAIFTYVDVKWGPAGTNVASRGDFAKIKMEGACSQRDVQINAI